MIAALGLFFSNTWAKALPYILATAAVLAVLIGLYEKGKSAGRAAIEVKNKAALIKAQKRNIDETKAANDARDSVRAIPPGRVHDRDNFSRD